MAGAQRCAALLVLRLRGDRAGGQGQLPLTQHLRNGTGAVEHTDVGRTDDLQAIRADGQLESLITQLDLLRCIQRERDVFARRGTGRGLDVHTGELGQFGCQALRTLGQDIARYDASAFAQRPRAGAIGPAVHARNRGRTGKPGEGSGAVPGGFVVVGRMRGCCGVYVKPLIRTFLHRNFLQSLVAVVSGGLRRLQWTPGGYNKIQPPRPTIE